MSDAARGQEKPCDKTGGPCVWVDECEAAPEIGLYPDLMCLRCFRPRDWSLAEYELPDGKAEK